MKQTVALLGAGTMGQGMGANLLKAGFALTVYNRTAERTGPLSALGAKVAATAAEAVDGASVVVAMLSDDAASRAAWLGDAGALAAAAPGTVLVDSSTVSPGWIAELARAAGERGLELLDAPVAGSREQAAGAQLTFFVGGTEAALDKARPVLMAMGKEAVLLGPSGSGAKMKLVNNFMAGVQMVSLAEAMVWLERSGLDVAKALEVLKRGAPGSPMVAGLTARIASGDTSVHFLLRLMMKDLQYAHDEAALGGVELTSAANARLTLERAVAEGLGERDISATVEAVRSGARPQ